MQKYLWDQLDKEIKKVEIVGEGTLRGEPVFAIIEWVKSERLHDTIDEHLKILVENERIQSKSK